MLSTIGFSTGAFAREEMPFKERIKLFRDLGCSGVELVYDEKEKFFKELPSGSHTRLLKNFKWVSLHEGSEQRYRKNQRTKTILNNIQKIHKIKPLNLVVFHPDLFDNFSVLDEYSFPIGMENMDNKKASFQRPDSFKPLFGEHPDWKLVLDLNHCYANDSSLILAKTMFTTFSNQLGEIHLSGFLKLHEPLFKTKQDIILTSVPLDNSTPIIIESELATKNDARREYKYILEILSR